MAGRISVPEESRTMRAPSKSGFFNAAKLWDLASITTILRAAPELVDARDPKGLNALHMACAVKPGKTSLGEPNGLKTAGMLLDAGIDVNAAAFEEDDGRWKANAVWFAVSRGRNLPLVKFLLKRGGDPTFAMFATMWGPKPDFLRALLKFTPSVNHMSHGSTALHTAANPNKLTFLGMLLDAGADPWIKDAAGLTAIDLAKKRRVPKEYIERMEATKYRKTR
jgi:ankyrin repeat protein